MIELRTPGHRDGFSIVVACMKKHEKKVLLPGIRGVVSLFVGSRIDTNDIDCLAHTLSFEDRDLLREAAHQVPKELEEEINLGPK